MKRLGRETWPRWRSFCPGSDSPLASAADCRGSVEAAPAVGTAPPLIRSPVCSGRLRYGEEGWCGPRHRPSLHARLSLGFECFKILPHAVVLNDHVLGRCRPEPGHASLLAPARCHLQKPPTESEYRPVLGLLHTIRSNPDKFCCQTHFSSVILLFLIYFVFKVESSSLTVSSRLNLSVVPGGNPQ